MAERGQTDRRVTVRHVLAALAELAGFALIAYAVTAARDPAPSFAGVEPSTPAVTVAPSSTVAVATSSAASATPTTLGPTTTAVAPTTTAAAPTFDVTSLAATCATIPQGSVDAKLAPSQLGSGHQPDARSNVPTDWVGVAYAAEMTDSFRTLAPFTVMIAIDDPAAAAPAPISGAVIDTLGQLQLWAAWDGANLHKSVRQWDGTAWTTLVDDEAEPLTLEMATVGVFFFWPDLVPGTKQAVVIAQAGACTQLGLGADNRPTVDITGVE